MKPKYILEEYVESELILGWVRSIYRLEQGENQPSFVYGIQEPESECIYYVAEEDLI